MSILMLLEHGRHSIENETEGQTQREQLRSKLSVQLAKAPKSISYGQLGVLVLVFIVGVVVTLIFQNVTRSENITFSTISLVSFLFSVALVGASIALAIIAITLGKSSEQAMIDRSDESIRLQNEIFLKTIDALQRIESSTGVTEKRIEDIVSGRVGDISHRVAERALDDRLVTRQGRIQLETDIQQSILNELSKDRRKQREEVEIIDRKKISEAYKRYKEFMDAILLGLASNPKIKSEKIGSGAYESSKEGLVDGVFIIDSHRFGVSVISINELLKDTFQEGFSDYMGRLAQEISDGTFTRVILAFDGKLAEDNVFYKQFTQAKALIRKDITDKLFIVSGTPEEINQHILSAIENKSTNA